MIVRKIKIIGGTALAIILLLLGYMVWNLLFPVDLSQDYRKIPGVNNIVFQLNGNRDVFRKRCFWGLQRTEEPESFVLHEKGKLNPETELILSVVDEHNIVQSVLSPDGNYILYCEKEYGYTKSGLTDDEYCYYKVYNIETGEVITIYEGYRAFYNVDWLE